MRRILYHLPGHSSLTPAVLAKVGLRDRFSDGGAGLISNCAIPVDEGPDGKSGLIIGAGAQPPTYAPDKQAWVEADNGVWIAMEDPDSAPGPADLQRFKQLPGYIAKLGDGSEWVVPLLLKFDPVNRRQISTLGRSLQPIRDGKGQGGYRWEERVRPQYAAIDALAQRVWNDFCEDFDSGKPITRDQVCADVAQLLNVNYRVGVAEVGLLGLIDPATVADIVVLAIDGPGFKQHFIEAHRGEFQLVEPAEAE